MTVYSCQPQEVCDTHHIHMYMHCTFTLLLISHEVQTFYKAYTSKEASVGIASGIEIQVNIKNPSSGFADDVCQQFSNAFQRLNTIKLQERENRQ